MANNALPENHRYAARMLATGVPAKIVAERLGTTPNVINGWAKGADFIELRNYYASELEAALEEDLIGATSEMLDLWRSWLRGETSANDERIKVFAPTILKWTESFFAIASPSAASANGKAGPTIQILNNPSGANVPFLRTGELANAEEDTLLDEVRGLPPPRSDRERRQGKPRRNRLQPVSVPAGDSEALGDRQ